MQEPLVIRCQCKPRCADWIRVAQEDRHVIGAPGTRLVIPGHAGRDDRIREIHPGYLVVTPP